MVQSNLPYIKVIGDKIRKMHFFCQMLRRYTRTTDGGYIAFLFFEDLRLYSFYRPKCIHFYKIFGQFELCCFCFNIFYRFSFFVFLWEVQLNYSRVITLVSYIPIFETHPKPLSIVTSRCDKDEPGFSLVLWRNKYERKQKKKLLLTFD